MPEEKVCELCGEPAEKRFCSPGCRDISEELDEPDEDRRKKVTEDDSEVMFLRVEGMHSAVSEDFLESVGKEIDGVVRVSASYVTGSVKIHHDGSVSREEVRDRLDTAGHTAYLREEEDDESNRGKVSGSKSRRDEPMIGVKHTFGVMLGGIILIPYISLVYPGYVLSFLGLDMGYDLSAVDGTKFLGIYLGLTGFVLYFTGLPLLRGAYIGLLMRKPNVDMVVSLSILSAYLYGTVAALAGRGDIYYDLTIVVSIVVVSAIFYESLMKERATEKLGDLTSSRVDEARLYTEDGTEDVDTDELTSGDRILIREGERVPRGGIVESGSCTVDESVVTGESLPVGKKEGDEVVGGSTVKSGAAVVRVTEDGSSGVKEITRGVWDIQSADHGVERRTNRIASVILPILVSAGIALGAGYYLLGAGPAESVLGALTVFLVVSPWGLGLVAPLTSGSSIEAATEKGIVVFDETHFERLRDIDTVVFDKTGTLTTGEMGVVGSEGPKEVLQMAASLEEFSTHPAAEAVSERFVSDPRGVGNVDTFSTGVSGEVGDERVLVGNTALFEKEGWKVPESVLETVAEDRGEGRLPVVVGVNGEAKAVVTLSDEHREGWRETVSALSKKGIEVVVLTGDNEEATLPFERHGDVSTALCEVPPKGKREAVRRLSEKGTVAMVGDGTNDALPLAEADFSISMGKGAAVASDAADLAIMRDDIRLVGEAFELSEESRTTYRRSLGISVFYNAVLAPFAVFGMLNPLLAVSAASLTAAAVWINSSVFGP
jgi:heavy metal translocating P-type ATPase